MKYIKSVNEYKRSAEDMKKYFFKGSRKKSGSAEWVIFDWLDIENESGENSISMQNMFENGKIIPEVKKEILKNKAPMMIKVLEWAIKNLHRERLYKFDSFSYTVYNKPIILYKKGGEAIKLPTEYVFISSLYPGDDHTLFYSDIDSKPYVYDTDLYVSAISTYTEEGFYDKLINGNSLIQSIIYAEYDLKRKNGPRTITTKTGKPGELYKKNFRTLDTMHSKPYMKNFNRMDDLRNQFGFFED